MKTETCSVVLTFEDEILWCDHSNGTSLVALSHGTISFSIFYKMKFENFLKFLFWTLSGVTGLNESDWDVRLFLLLVNLWRYV